MNKKFTKLMAALALLAFLAVPMGMWGQTTTLVSGSGTSGYSIPEGWTDSGTVEGGSYLKFDNGTITSPAFAPHNGLSFTYTVATFGSGTNHPLTIRILNASTNAVIVEKTTATPTSSSYISTDSPLSLGDVAVAFKIQMYGPTGKGVRLRNYSVTGTPAGDIPTTYTVTYDANGGSGTMTDSDSPYTAGATVTVLGNEFTRTDYEFDHWNTAADDSGTSYDEDDTFTINANTTLYAQWTENTTPGPGGNTQTLTFNLSSNPGGWPTTNSTTLTNYTYTLNSVSYTFALKNVKCNSGYLMMTATAVLGLPAIEGYKLTKVVASNSSNCSTSVKVGISSSATQESYIAGGAIQTWSTQSSSYTYNLTSTEPNTMYYMYVTSKNAQVLGLELTYEADGSAPAPSITANNENITYDATSGSITYTINNEPSPAGTLTASVPQNSWLTLGTVGATVPFTCSQNPTNAARTETVTLTYTYNTNETATTTVTVTQAGNPNIVDLISDINAINTNYTIRGTVVAVNARGCVIGDGTGYINFYNGYTAPEVAVNDVVTVSGSMTSYGNIYQFSNNSPNTATIVTAESSNYDGNPAITVINVIPTSTYSSGLHLSDYFQFEGTLTKSSGYYYVTVGEGQINIAYPSSDQQTAMNALENKTVRVTGYFAGINSSSYFSVMMESIEEVVSTDPFVTLSVSEIEAPYTGKDGSILITYDNLPEEYSFDIYFCDANGDELDGDDPDWIYAAIDADTVDYIIDVNHDIIEARTAYFKVSASWLDGDDQEITIYSDLVTVSQEAAPEPSITVANATVNVDAEEHDGTLALTYENLPITDMEDFDIQYYDAEGVQTTEPNWVEALVAQETDGSYVVSYYMLENEGTEARTVYFKVWALDDNAEEVYSNLVTITQAAPVAPGNWVLTNLADLTEDDIFVIVGTINAGTYALPSESVSSQNAPAAMAVTVVEGTLSEEPAAELQWNLVGNAEDGYTFYVNGNHNSWLYCSTNAATGSNNNMKVGGGGNTNRNVFVLDEDNYLVTNDDDVDRYLSIYVNGGTAQDWRGYINTSNNPAVISFYKKVVEPATKTYELTINGYGSSTTGGWYLIASPVLSITPTLANGFITDDNTDPDNLTYDLYYFDQTGGDNGKEWKNYRQHTFNLESGQGYLYASKEGTDLIFTGTAYNGNGVVNLTYSELETIDDNMRGWNLIGNPFGTTANLPSGLSYYTLNESRTELTPGSATAIGAMKAIFVKATATGQSVAFTKQTRNAGSNAILSLDLSSINNGLIDRAIVRFDEGNALPKFMLNPNNTKVFIPVESKDYAVVRHEAQGEMPVNFKAAENGTYTLTVNPEGVEMNYLHLIDNMTGNDIDLLCTPSYSFNATTNDFESRFRLVFAAANNEDGASTGSAAFAFMSDGNWIINNAGEATLQVIDLNGRILSSERVNGSVSKTINATPGVYMLRLINGENVNVQKIVVR